MDKLHIILPLKRFLLIETCPPDWARLDLYLCRDDSVAFYAGQSQQAFARVWEHLLGGFHGHSIIGRFIWCNWPKSMNFTVELLGSKSEQFAGVGHDLDGAERQLIERWSPCFNVSLNSQPTPVPDCYLPPNAPFRRRKSLNMLIREAGRAVQVEDTARWLEEVLQGSA